MAGKERAQNNFGTWSPRIIMALCEILWVIKFGFHVSVIVIGEVVGYSHPDFLKRRYRIPQIKVMAVRAAG
jgi:hypothetical protein